MGFTRFYGTDEDNPVPMTLEEVRAGVLAIKAVAERRSDEFEFGYSETSITVDVRSDNPVETLCFDPEEVEGGYIVEGESCKTNRHPEDEGILEMLEALVRAVNHKLVLDEDD